MFSQRIVYFVLSIIFVIYQLGFTVNSLEEFLISCLAEDDTITAPKFETPDASINYTSVEVLLCHNPSTVYTKMLESIPLKMPKILKTYLRNGTAIRPDQFNGLQVEKLVIKYIGVNNTFTGDILPNLTRVKKFHLINAVLKPLPQTTIKELRLWNGESAGNFGDCSNLEKLYLFIWNVTKIPDNWLMNCTKLNFMSLQELDVRAVEKVLAGPNSIKKLEISACGLLFISPEFMAMIKGVKELYLYNNRIKNIRVGRIYPLLEVLDLSNNEITNLHEVMTFLKTQNESLVSFSIKKNRVLEICSQDNAPRNPNFSKIPLFRAILSRERTYDYWNSLTMLKLKRLILSSTATSKLCMHSFNAPVLEFLDLSNIRITTLEVYHLPLRFTTHLKEIKIDNTPIKIVNFQANDFGLLNRHSQPLKITGLNLTLDCDCANTWLARAVYYKRIILEAYCKNNNIQFERAPLENFECDKYNCEECLCRRSLRFNNLSAYCNGQQTKIPQVTNLTTLIAPGNLIKSFNATDIDDDLVKLDLRKNHIAKLDPNVVEALFNVSERRLNLSGNPLVCDCDNVPLLEAFRTHRHQIEDYENITCVGDDGLGLDELDFEELCTKPLNARIITASFLLLGFCAALAVTMALYLKFETQIKVYLYARGWCIWWISEEEVDAARPFDAFVSFSHADEDFVMETLLPELEQCGYKLCVHNRNWVIGEWIPTQITRSISLSRRIIFIISKNFLESVWGLLEFRLAHISTLREGRIRIIMLLLEDVEDVKMDDELRGYLKNNTYLKWRESWFWDKLKYSLPHRFKIEANIEMGKIEPLIMVGPTYMS